MVLGAFVFSCQDWPELASPRIDAPSDAGLEGAADECATCWDDCGRAMSRDEASFCSWACGVICEGH